MPAHSLRKHQQAASEGGAGVGSPGAERSVGPYSPGGPREPQRVRHTSPPACGPCPPSRERGGPVTQSSVPHLECPSSAPCGRDLADGVAAAVFWGLISLLMQPWLPLGQDRTFLSPSSSGCPCPAPSPDLPQALGSSNVTSPFSPGPGYRFTLSCRAQGPPDCTQPRGCHPCPRPTKDSSQRSHSGGNAT